MLLDTGREPFYMPPQSGTFFPGYLLVSFDPSGEAYAPLLRWNRELRTRKLLCDTSYNPLALPDGAVEALQGQGRAGDGAIDLSCPVPVLNAGDQVTVREGPFADRKALVGWTDQQRVQVLIGVLRVSLRRGQVS
jgi:transcription antitermination factor NusG